MDCSVYEVLSILLTSEDFRHFLGRSIIQRLMDLLAQADSDTLGCIG